METDSKFSKEIIIPGDIQNEIIGVYDANITKIEKNLDVEFSSHNGVNIFFLETKRMLRQPVRL